MLRGVRQQQDELERFSICSRQAAVVQEILIKIELLSGSWQQITATRPLKSVERC